jgi:CBS domain-containing protein
MRASELMSSPPVTVWPETPIKEAAAILTEKRISALPVVDGNGDLLGIVSEADLIALETNPDPRSQATPIPPRPEPVPSNVADVMTKDVVTVSEETDVAIAARLMLEAVVKRLPVLRGRQVVGILSRHDLLKVLARDDKGIEESVRMALGEEGRRMGELTIEVRGGIVEISGTTDVRLLRLADVLARTVPGVLDVRHVPHGQ